jgi:hypothetical protein
MNWFSSKGKELRTMLGISFEYGDYLIIHAELFTNSVWDWGQSFYVESLLLLYVNKKNQVNI